MQEALHGNRRRDRLEEALLRYLRTGDSQAWSAIVQVTRPRLLVAARRIGRPQDAEDAVQEAYLSLVRNGRTAEGIPVFPWLLTATVRIAYRQKAVLAREDRLAALLARDPPRDGGPLADAATAEEAARLRNEVDRLPETYRNTVILHYFQGLSTAETALLLGASDSAVRVRLHRARLLLRLRWVPSVVLGALAFPWSIAGFGKGQGTGAALTAGTLAGKGGTVGALVAAAVMAAFFAGRSVASRGPSTGPQPEPAAEIASLRAEADGLRRRLAESRAQVAAARESAARTLAAEAAAPSGPSGSREPPSNPGAGIGGETPAPEAGERGGGEGGAGGSVAGPRFPFAAHERALRGVDWASIGRSFASFPPLLRALGEADEEKKPPDLGMLARIQQGRTVIAMAAKEFAGSMPGTDPFSAATHPEFMANAIAATLDAAGLPLDEEQARSLDSAGRDFGTRDARRLAGQAADGWILERAIGEAELKDAFFAAALGPLTAAQRDALCPSGTRGMVSLDPFSSGTMWTPYFKPVVFTDRDDLVGKVAALIEEQLAIPEGRSADARTLVARWAESLPAEWMSVEPVRVFGVPLVSVARMEDGAARQVGLLRSALPLSGAADGAARAAGCSWVGVPLFRKR